MTEFGAWFILACIAIAVMSILVMLLCLFAVVVVWVARRISNPLGVVALVVSIGLVSPVMTAGDASQDDSGQQEQERIRPKPGPYEIEGFPTIR